MISQKISRKGLLTSILSQDLFPFWLLKHCLVCYWPHNKICFTYVVLKKHVTWCFLKTPQWSDLISFVDEINNSWMRCFFTNRNFCLQRRWCKKCSVTGTETRWRRWWLTETRCIFTFLRFLQKMQRKKLFDVRICIMQSVFFYI